MPNYQTTENGFVSSTLTEQEIANLFKNLNLLRKDAYANFELVVDGHVTIETLRIAKQLTGGSFKEFLEVNYDHGRGSLANLIKNILHFLNGKVGSGSVTALLKVEELKMSGPNRNRSPIYTPTQRTGNSLPMLEDGYVVNDYDLYRLMSGISPANVGRFFQLFGGESYYV